MSARTRFFHRSSLLLAAACSPPHAVGPASARATVEIPAAASVQPAAERTDDARTILEQLVAAERAYQERADPEPFFVLFAPDLQVHAARLAAPGPTDLTFGRSRLVAIYRWEARQGFRSEFTYADEKVRVDGDHAWLEWRTQTESASGTNAFRERYHWERRQRRWKIVDFSYWPLRPDTHQDFGTEYFASVDQQLREAVAAGDLRQAVWFSMLGYRFADSAELARRLTASEPEEPWAWEMRGWSSALVGDTEDADRAALEARRLKAKRAPAKEPTN